MCQGVFVMDHASFKGSSSSRLLKKHLYSIFLLQGPCPGVAFQGASLWLDTGSSLASPVICSTPIAKSSFFLVNPGITKSQNTPKALQVFWDSPERGLYLLSFLQDPLKLTLVWLCRGQASAFEMQAFLCPWLSWWSIAVLPQRALLLFG